MSPRVNRDVSAIEVEIGAHSIGRGTSEEGGGQIQGGLFLTSRFTARIADPEVPYVITMTMAARDGWLACESVTVDALPDGPAVGSATVRGLALSIYVQCIRQELGRTLGGGLIVKPVGRTENAHAYAPPMSQDDWKDYDYAQIRRAVHTSKITPEMAAAAYREALASPDPDKNHRPTAAAAEMIGASRGHVSRLLTEARRMGLAGLGPQRTTPGRADQDSAGDEITLVPLVDLTDEERDKATQAAADMQGQGYGDRYTVGGDAQGLTVFPAEVPMGVAPPPLYRIRRGGQDAPGKRSGARSRRSEP